MYYSGSQSYSSAPYSYGSSVSPYGSSYSASYLNPGGNYSLHSSLGGYSRAPLTSRWLTSGSRAYSPMLSTISEKNTISPVRINSPRRTPLSNRSYVSSQYTHRPININTADIDVSKDKYRYKNLNTTSDITTKLPPRNDSPKTSKEKGHDKPNTGIDSSPGPKRTTIKRERTVVRLHTVKRKERDSPRKPVETDQNKDTSTSTNSENFEKENDTIKWRQKLADDLSYKVQREKKSLGAKLVEKFTLKDREDNEVGLKTKTSPSSEIIKDSISENKNVDDSNSLDKCLARRCSMELLAEQACLFDSLIRRENLSTASLDLSKIGNAKDSPEETILENTKRRKISGQQNPLTTTKSDQCLHDRLLNKSFKDKRHPKRGSLRKCSSGGNIYKLDSITELPKNTASLNSDNVEDIKVLKTKLKTKITSTVEVTTPPTPLKFIVENVTVEEKSRPFKKDIIFSSTVDENHSLGQSIEVREESIPNEKFNIENVVIIDKINNTPIESDKLIDSTNEKMPQTTSDKFLKGHRKSIKSKIKPKPTLETTGDLTSPEPEDGNFWDKIGKRETIYLNKRKQNIQDIQEKIKRSFWFPEEEVEEEFASSDSIDLDSKTKEENNENTAFEIKDKSLLKNVGLSVNKNILENDITILSKTIDENKLKNELVTTNFSDAIMETVDKSKAVCKNKSNEIENKVDEECKNLRDKQEEESCNIMILEPKKDNKRVGNIAKCHSEDNKKDVMCQNKLKKLNEQIEEKQKSSKLYLKPKTQEQHDKSKICLSLEDSCLPSVETNNLENSVQSDFKTIITKKDPDDNDNCDREVNNLKNVVTQIKLKEKSKKVKDKQKVNKTLSKSKSPKNVKNCETDLALQNTFSATANNIGNKLEKDSTSNFNLSTKDVLQPLNIPSTITNISEAMSNKETEIINEISLDHTRNNLKTEASIKEGKNTSNLQSSPERVIHNECTSNIINIPTNEVEVHKSIKNKNNDLNIIEDPEDNKVTGDNKHNKLPAKDTITPPKKIKEQKAQVLLIATPRPLQKRSPQVIRSSSSSEASDDSSEEDEKKSESSEEGSTEFFECENNTDGRTSTGSNDSGFDSSAPTSPASFLHVKKDCDVNCHRKCEKLTANLCGVNQRLLVEALATGTSSKKGGDTPSTSTGPAPSQTYNYDISEQELENSTAYELFRKTGRFTPPARSIPRFRKYTIDDFQFIRVLGKGSFGKVMLAELRDTEYYYAVKCLKKDVVLEDDDVECTLIERKVLALGTNHPYLCHLFATFQTDSHLFFVMEYLNGGDLMFHIQQSGRFPEARARLYAAEIVSGLKFLHKRGIVYRDLKLDNILLDFDGHVRIADFGMCKLQIYLDKTADTFCGTPDYMAPEIIKGLKYNQTVDWWSFGVLLYEMLIGQSPFSGCDEDELFWSICNEMPSYPRFLSKEALSILTRLLDKDGRRRLGGAECALGDVRDQDFFRPIHWERLERRDLDAPFKPRVRHPMDTQYFDRAFTGERPRLTTVEPQVLRSMDQEPFRGFSYTNPNATDR